MLLTITQEHINKARKDEGTRTLAQTCPIWQAFHEIGLEVSVGWTGETYTIFRTVSGLPSGDCIARIEQGSPLYDVADWFDAPNMWHDSGRSEPTFPVSAEIEVL